ncbi:MAG: acyl carrier protein [Oscillospiraceae bacterium]|nr:acyl carrier protein [Oscillospiraceae bacterium]
MTKEEMKVLFAQAWKEVFQVDEVADNSDFFESGGDSIMAVQLAAWLIQKGVKLDLVDLFTSGTFGAIADKLTEGEPMYVPEEMMTKEIAAKEMGFNSVEEAEAAEKAGMGAPAMNPMGDQQACNPVGGQQVCNPMGSQQACSPMGNQQACNPMGNQQVCNPMGGQQVCNPMGSQQVCNPMGGQQVCNPMGGQQVCNPMGGQQVCNPMGGQQVCNPMGGQQVCNPMGGQQICNPMGGQQVCNPMGGQQVCNPMGGQQVCNPSENVVDPLSMIPPQIRKYISRPVDQPIENPNVIKINKVKLGEKVNAPEEVLTSVLQGLLSNFDPSVDLFEQGLTSLDTVKMVTRCAEAGYELQMKDIYTNSTFDALVKCMK